MGTLRGGESTQNLPAVIMFEPFVLTGSGDTKRLFLHAHPFALMEGWWDDRGWLVCYIW